MTRDRDIKRQVRARMRATGERYTQARSALYGSSASTPAIGSRPDAEGGAMRSEELLERLDRDGYAVVRGAVPERTVDEIRRWIDELVDADLDSRMRDAQRRRDAGEADARAFGRGFEGRIGLAIGDDARLSRLVEGVQELVHAIGTSRRGTTAGIAACLPGWGGHDGLHQDLTGPAPEIGRWDGAVLTFPMSAWEGMRLIPGSHRRDPAFGEGYASAVAPHPDEVYVDAGPGDVVINSIHIYKSATLNRSTERRCEVWVGYNDGEETSSKVAAYWAQAEIRHGDAPADA
jgi:hypothetical protein